MYVSMFVHAMHVCAHACTWYACMTVHVRTWYTCMCACLYMICMYVCMLVNVMYACMRVCLCPCMCVRCSSSCFLWPQTLSLYAYSYIFPHTPKHWWQMRSIFLHILSIYYLLFPCLLEIKYMTNNHSIETQQTRSISGYQLVEL